MGRSDLWAVLLICRFDGFRLAGEAIYKSNFADLLDKRFGCNFSNLKIKLLTSNYEQLFQFLRKRFQSNFGDFLKKRFKGSFAGKAIWRPILQFYEEAIYEQFCWRTNYRSSVFPRKRFQSNFADFLKKLYLEATSLIWWRTLCVEEVIYWILDCFGGTI